MEWYDGAQVCLNGHMVNDSMRRFPQHNKPYCPKCGAKTITQCPSCDNDIQGEYHSDIVASMGLREPANFCHQCGSPYPWTQARIKAAQELISESPLPPDEQRQLKDSIIHIMIESPSTELAASRFKKFLATMGPATADIFNKTMAGVITASAKRIISQRL